MKKLLFVLAVLISFSSIAQSTSETFLLKNIGYISIPSEMELQSGSYKKFVDNYKQTLAKKFDWEVSDSRIVFQQSGLNEFDKSSYSSYARVILETFIERPGTFEKISTKLAATATELNQISAQFKSELSDAYSDTGIRIIEWYGAQISNVNGRTALKFSFLRQLRDQPYVYVTVYQFHNNDRMHQLTMSYRQHDASKWKPIYSKILNSFTITTVR